MCSWWQVFFFQVVYQSVMPRLVDYFVVCGLHSAELEQDVLPSECVVCVCVCVLDVA